MYLYLISFPLPSPSPPEYNRGMDEHDDGPIVGRTENALLVKAMIGVAAATSPLWMSWAIDSYLAAAGDDWPIWLRRDGGCILGAFSVWFFVRWINRRDDPRRGKSPPGPD
jgi:hypothetical protein